MDLQTATPSQIDTELAAQHEAVALAERTIQAMVKMLHSLVGDRQEMIGRTRTGRSIYGWGMSDDDVMTAARSGNASQWTDIRRQITERLATVDEQTGQLTQATKRITERQAEFTRRGGWSRFFLVQGGHVHSSMSCSTCNNGAEPTTFGWLPEWSGQSERECIEGLRGQGGDRRAAIMCSVCFPSAPVEWTTRPVDETACPGSRDWNAPARQGYCYGNWATCDTCHGHIAVTSTGKIRKHKPAAQTAA